MRRDEVDVLARGAGDVIVQIAQHVLTLPIWVLEDNGGGEALLEQIRRFSQEVGGNDGKVVAPLSAQAIAGDDRAGGGHVDAAQVGVRAPCLWAVQQFQQR